MYITLRSPLEYLLHYVAPVRTHYLHPLSLDGTSLEVDNSGGNVYFGEQPAGRLQKKIVINITIGKNKIRINKQQQQKLARIAHLTCHITVIVINFIFHKIIAYFLHLREL